MTLLQVCEDAEICGLKTLKETILNFEIHGIHFITFAEQMNELNSLYQDFDNSGYNDDTLILDVIADKKKLLPVATITYHKFEIRKNHIKPRNKK